MFTPHKIVKILGLDRKNKVNNHFDIDLKSHLFYISTPLNEIKHTHTHTLLTQM